MNPRREAVRKLLNRAQAHANMLETLATQSRLMVQAVSMGHFKHVVTDTYAAEHAYGVMNELRSATYDLTRMFPDYSQLRELEQMPEDDGENEPQEGKEN